VSEPFGGSIPDKISLRDEAKIAWDPATEEAADAVRARIGKRLASSWRSSCPTFRTCDGGTVMSMPHAPCGFSRSPRDGVDGAEVYGLILDGELPAANGDDGLVYVTAEALREFQRRHAPTPQ
jgi:hypothetical protein